MKIGCDIVENERLTDVSDEFIERVLTKKEIENYHKYGIDYLAGRFAAKEAIMKALPNTKQLTFLDIEILNDETGQPYCTNIKDIEVSISHENNYTIATALYIK